MPSNYFTNYRALSNYCDEFIGQFLRTLGKSYVGYADVGECFTALNKISDKDFNGWYDAWHHLATHLEALANKAWHKGLSLTSATTYLRAAEYHRASEFFLRHDLNDPRILSCFDDIRFCFEKSMSVLHPRMECVLIPYDGTTLSGYYFSVQTDAKATLIVPGGYDSTAEEMYALVPSAMKHGYNILLFDGPGQGQVLRRQALYMRYDFEHVISQVVNWLEKKGIVTPYVLIGRSFGGYLSPRAACFEQRIAGLVCDPGQMDIAGSLFKVVPTEILDDFKRGDALAVNEFYEAMFARSPLNAFYFHSRMNVHGIKTPFDYLCELQHYSFKNQVQRIQCPTLVCDNVCDVVSTRGNTLFEALQCEKTLASFDGQWGGGMHCEGDAIGQFEYVLFDWLETNHDKINAYHMAL